MITYFQIGKIIVIHEYLVLININNKTYLDKTRVIPINLFTCLIILEIDYLADSTMTYFNKFFSLIIFPS